MGQSLLLATGSMWSVGASGPTEVHQDTVVLPLRVGIDWDAARAQDGLENVDDTGVSFIGSLVFAYVSASGKSYDQFDYMSVDATDDCYEIDLVYPPLESIECKHYVNVPGDEIPGGAWKIANNRGDAVFIVGG
ncbi:hypothetical protein [Microbacterium sp.]|uniref:hypothetical protein n=1 Tax=Actinomycetes TaxID=1760 RepID=UPI0037CBCCA7